MFKGAISRAIGVAKRFKGPRPEAKSEWITSGAAMQTTETINWARRKFTDASVDDVL